MPAKLVNIQKTTYSPQDLIKAFVGAWIELYGKTPTKESIGVLFAQNSLETGSTKSMWNNNIGNVKYIPKSTDDESIEYFMLPNTWEIIAGKKIVFSPPNPQTWFRSFPTLEKGVAHHFKFLKNGRYLTSWTAIEAGDPALFAHLLKLKGYYTAPEADYVKLMKYFFNKFMTSNDFENAVDQIQKESELAKPLNPEPEPIVPPAPEPQVEKLEISLPENHQPINDVPLNSPKDRAPIQISNIDKFVATVSMLFSTIPWGKVIDFISSIIKKR